MKPTKKTKKVLPEVHILGDLKDVKNLISILNKKKTIVIFHNGELDTFYLEIDGKFKQILQNDFAHLEKKYKLVLFSFFPNRKKLETTIEEKQVAQESEKSAIQDLKPIEKKEKGNKKVKTEKKKK